MDEEYFYYPLGDNPFKYNQDIKNEYYKYLDVEDELEDMVFDGVLDILVDQNGTFHYIPSKNTMKSLGIYAKEAKSCDFSMFLKVRGLNINTFRLYLSMTKRKRK